MEFVTKDSHVAYTKSFRNNDNITNLRKNTFPTYTILGSFPQQSIARDSDIFYTFFNEYFVNFTFFTGNNLPLEDIEKGSYLI